MSGPVAHGVALVALIQRAVDEKLPDEELLDLVNGYMTDEALGRKDLAGVAIFLAQTVQTQVALHAMRWDGELSAAEIVADWGERCAAKVEADDD